MKKKLITYLTIALLLSVSTQISAMNSSEGGNTYSGSVGGTGKSHSGYGPGLTGNYDDAMPTQGVDEEGNTFAISYDDPETWAIADSSGQYASVDVMPEDWDESYEEKDLEENLNDSNDFYDEDSDTDEAFYDENRQWKMHSNARNNR